jgi:uncharacterized membrane protein YgdD (TMEM256/DUF423 family)
MMSKVFIILGSLNAFLAVALGAFGAHGLQNKLTEQMLATYETGVKYHMMHALGLILIGIISRYTSGSVLINWSGWLICAGIVLFSGSLYLLSIGGIRWLGAITPLGGLSFLAGWILLAIAAFKYL